MSLLSMIQDSMDEHPDSTLMEMNQRDVMSEDKFAMESLSADASSSMEASHHAESVTSMTAEQILSAVEAHIEFADSINEDRFTPDAICRALEEGLPTEVPAYDPTADLEHVSTILQGIDTDDELDPDQPQPDEQIDPDTDVDELNATVEAYLDAMDEIDIFAATEGTNIDALSLRFKQRHKELKPVRKEMRKAAKAKDFRTAAKKAKECASICKKIEDDLKNLPGSISSTLISQLIRLVGDIWIAAMIREAASLGGPILSHAMNKGLSLDDAMNVSTVGGIAMVGQFFMAMKRTGSALATVLRREKIVDDNGNIITHTNYTNNDANAIVTSARSDLQRATKHYEKLALDYAKKANKRGEAPGESDADVDEPVAEPATEGLLHFFKRIREKRAAKRNARREEMRAQHLALMSRDDRTAVVRAAEEAARAAVKQLGDMGKYFAVYGVNDNETDEFLCRTTGRNSYDDDFFICVYASIRGEVPQYQTTKRVMNYGISNQVGSNYDAPLVVNRQYQNETVFMDDGEACQKWMSDNRATMQRLRTAMNTISSAVGKALEAYPSVELAFHGKFTEGVVENAGEWALGVVITEKYCHDAVFDGKIPEKYDIVAPIYQKSMDAFIADMGGMTPASEGIGDNIRQHIGNFKNRKVEGNITDYAAEHSIQCKNIAELVAKAREERKVRTILNGFSIVVRMSSDATEIPYATERAIGRAYSNIAEVQKRLADVIVTAYNDSNGSNGPWAWSEEVENGAEFKKRRASEVSNAIKLETLDIRVLADGTIDAAYWFHDGGLYGGHVLIVDNLIDPKTGNTNKEEAKYSIEG